MITSLAISLLILVLIGLEVASFALRQKHKTQERDNLKALGTFLNDMNKVVGAAVATSQAVQREAHAAFKASIDPPPPQVGTRVYAAILNYQDMARLYVAPSTSIDDFAKKGQALLGDQWIASVIDFVDVFPPQTEKIVRVPVLPTKAEAREANVESTIQHLTYYRENYAETPYQKETMDNIIKNVKTKYGLST